MYGHGKLHFFSFCLIKGLHLFVVFKVSSLIKKGLSSTCRVIFKILLNEEKTKSFLTGTEQQLAKVDIGHIKVGKVNIAPLSPVKNLGVWFDSNLSMVDHITKTYSAAFYYLYNIRRIRKYLTKGYKETSSQITESPECSCTPHISREQILSYHISA